MDPDGRNPVYNTEGDLIGVTEDSGLTSIPGNIATFFGSLYAGKRSSYKINFYGLQTLKKAR